MRTSARGAAIAMCASLACASSASNEGAGASDDRGGNGGDVDGGSAPEGGGADASAAHVVFVTRGDERDVERLPREPAHVDDDRSPPRIRPTRPAMYTVP